MRGRGGCRDPACSTLARFYNFPIERFLHRGEGMCARDTPPPISIISHEVGLGEYSGKRGRVTRSCIYLHHSISTTFPVTELYNLP